MSRGKTLSSKTVAPNSTTQEISPPKGKNWKSNQRKKRKRLEKGSKDIVSGVINDMYGNFKTLFDRLHNLPLNGLTPQEKVDVQHIITHGVERSNSVLSSMVTHAYDDIYEVERIVGIKLLLWIMLKKTRTSD